MAFKVGDKVVNIEQISRKKGETIPTVGEIYTVRTVENFSGWGLCIRLVEIINEPKRYSNGFVECDFLGTCFRKLDYEFAEEVLKKIKSDPIPLLK